jgi:hypothetical protein
MFLFGSADLRGDSDRARVFSIVEAKERVLNACRRKEGLNEVYVRKFEVGDDPCKLENGEDQCRRMGFFRKATSFGKISSQDQAAGAGDTGWESRPAARRAETKNVSSRCTHCSSHR